MQPAIKTCVNIQTSGNRVNTKDYCEANAALTSGQGSSTWYKDRKALLSEKKQK